MASLQLSFAVLVCSSFLVLITSPLPATTSPVPVVSRDTLPVMLNSGNPVQLYNFTLYSVWLQASLFINHGGELRVLPHCQNTTDFLSSASADALNYHSQDVTNSKRMLRVCNEHLSYFSAQSRLCSYVSADGRYLLAMHASTGLLTAIPMQQRDGSLDEQGFCTRFNETVARDTATNTHMAIRTACGDSYPARFLAMDGPSVQKSDGHLRCKSTGSFVQAGRLEADISNKEKGFFPRQTEFITVNQFITGHTQRLNTQQQCSAQRQQIWKECHGPQPSRPSYPLTWQTPSNCPLVAATPSATIAASASS